jgi:hypothetical protein
MVLSTFNCVSPNICTIVARLSVARLSSVDMGGGWSLCQALPRPTLPYPRIAWLLNAVRGYLFESFDH